MSDRAPEPDPNATYDAEGKEVPKPKKGRMARRATALFKSATGSAGSKHDKSIPSFGSTGSKAHMAHLAERGHPCPTVTPALLRTYLRRFEEEGALPRAAIPKMLRVVFRRRCLGP